MPSTFAGRGGAPVAGDCAKEALMDIAGTLAAMQTIALTRDPCFHPLSPVRPSPGRLSTNAPGSMLLHTDGNGRAVPICNQEETGNG